MYRSASGDVSDSAIYSAGASGSYFAAYSSETVSSSQWNTDKPMCPSEQLTSRQWSMRQAVINRISMSESVNPGQTPHYEYKGDSSPGSSQSGSQFV
jgi:hypothetical protein